MHQHRGRRLGDELGDGGQHRAALAEESEVGGGQVGSFRPLFASAVSRIVQQRYRVRGRGLIGQRMTLPAQFVVVAGLQSAVLGVSSRPGRPTNIFSSNRSRCLRVIKR